MAVFNAFYFDGVSSLDRGLRLVREAGVDARTERTDTEDAIFLTIRIPKQPSS